nr:MAG TPA: hypothetical protein [Caudoviricetes sp.]
MKQPKTIKITEIAFRQIALSRLRTRSSRSFILLSWSI